MKINTSRHRTVMSLDEYVPGIKSGTFIAPNASVVGSVVIDSNCSLWHNVVVRGDFNQVQIEENTHIMDNTVISTAPHTPTGVPSMIQIGKNTIVQPNCTISSCFIGNNVFVGSGTVIMEGVKIEDNVWIESGSLVSPGALLESGKRYGGSPIQEIEGVENDIASFEIMLELLNKNKEEYKKELIDRNFNQLLRDKDMRYKLGDGEEKLL
eukprot:Mrub_08652.p1 GENE.Mrub_08652~~Mrub_08652.p1  ORF type:complete len:243 (-),score=58.39 Mrub_08652:87-716(-)